MEIWDTDSDEEGCEDNENIKDSMPQIVKHLPIFIMFWQALFKVSNTAIRCLLSFLRFFIGALGGVFGCTLLNDARQFIPLTPCKHSA